MQASNQILGDRSKYLGASEIPAVAGLSPYNSALGVWLEKTGQMPPFEGNLATELGTFLEPFLSRLYSERTGIELETPAGIAHPEHPFLVAHLDRVTGSGRVVELKTASRYVAHRWGDDGTDQVPEEYLAQVQVQMAIRRAIGQPCDDSADIAALIDGEFRIYTLPWDAELASGLLTIGARFWRRHIIGGEPPAVDASEAASRWLADRYPRVARPETVESTPEADRWAAQLAEAKSLLKQAEAMEAEAKANLQALIGDASGIRGEWGRASWSDCKGRATTNWKDVAAEAGVSQDLIERHTNRSPYRMFRFTPAKEK